MPVIDARVRLPQDLRQTSSYESMDTGQYDRILGLSGKMNAGTFAALLAEMDANGVDRAVMHAETEGGEESGQNPESNQDGCLGPPQHLKVVVDGCNLEDAATEQTKAQHLQHDRDRLNNKESTNNDKKEVEIHQCTQRRQRRPDRE